MTDGLNPLVTEALLEVGTRPRRVVSDAGVLAILRGVNCNPGADLEDMVAMRTLSMKGDVQGQEKRLGGCASGGFGAIK
jgi:zinc transporter